MLDIWVYEQTPVHKDIGTRTDLVPIRTVERSGDRLFSSLFQGPHGFSLFRDICVSLGTSGSFFSLLHLTSVF